MKIITVHGDYFLKEKAKSWAEIIYQLEQNNDLLTPIYFDKKTLQQSIRLNIDPPFSVILLSDYLNDALKIKPKYYDKLQQLIQKEIICFDMRMFSIDQNCLIAEMLVKMLFYKESPPKICILLVEEPHGIEIANIWDQSFFIRPDLAQFFNVGNVQKKLKRKAFLLCLLRWLGDSKITRILYKARRFCKRVLSKVGLH